MKCSSPEHGIEHEYSYPDSSYVGNSELLEEGAICDASMQGVIYICTEGFDSPGGPNPTLTRLVGA
jgi:hypothetical protein